MNDLIDILLPHMSDTNSRRALVESALFACPVLNQIDWTGNAHTFTVNLVRTLLNFGECEPGRPAVVMLLQEIRQHVGVNKHPQIDTLIQKYTPQAQKGQSVMALDQIALVGFLMEVGRWAKSELSQIWKVRHEQQEAELTDKPSVTQQVQTLVAETGEREVERVAKLIERKRDAIFRARNAKLADREEFDAQRLTKSAFEYREEDHNRTIQQMMDEIESDLVDLGFDVERIDS